MHSRGVCCRWLWKESITVGNDQYVKHFHYTDLFDSIVKQVTAQGGYARTHPHLAPASAAQVAASLRILPSTAFNIELPAACPHPAPAHITTYADVSVANPRNQSWSLAAAGVWTPYPQNNSHDSTSSTAHANTAPPISLT